MKSPKRQVRDGAKRKGWAEAHSSPIWGGTGVYIVFALPPFEGYVSNSGNGAMFTWAIHWRSPWPASYCSPITFDPLTGAADDVPNAQYLIESMISALVHACAVAEERSKAGYVSEVAL